MLELTTVQIPFEYITTVHHLDGIPLSPQVCCLLKQTTTVEPVHLGLEALTVQHLIHDCIN